jgi:hypothetical protein
MIDRAASTVRRGFNFVTRRPGVDVQGFWTNGYTIVRGVYSSDEVTQLRQIAKAYDGPKGDLLSTPGLNEVLLDGRLVRIAQAILGRDEIMYAGDGSFTINAVQHGYHKDNADREDSAAPDWQDPYTVLRFGIYLQGHLLHSGGLNLRVGSHNTTSLTEGRNIYVRSCVGDVVVWSLRTSHSGNATQLLFPCWIHPDPKQDGKYPAWWRVAKKATGDRMAIFAALGLDDAHHDRYTEYLKTRGYMVNAWRKSHYDAETLGRAAAGGLTVRNLPLEVEGDDTLGQRSAWAPLPY